MTAIGWGDREAIGGNRPADSEAWGEPARDAVATATRDFDAAASLHQRGMLAEAEQIYRSVLRITFDCLHNLGLLLAQGSRFDEAAAMLRAAIRQDPRAADAHSNLGNVLAASGDRAGAAASYRSAIALRPDHPEAHNNLATVLVMQGERAAAATHYQQALAFRPDYVEAHANLGNLFREQGRLDEAAAHLKQALAARPGDPQLYCQLGNIQRRRGKASEAMACYGRALALKPELVEAHCNLGVVCLEERELVRARSCFERAVSLQPGTSEAWLGLGHVLQQSKLYDDALAAYGKACALPEAWLGRGLALQRLKRPREAIEAYRQALAQGADAEVARYNLASLGAEPTPPATPSPIVARNYDQQAAQYDQRHLGPLKYRTPALLREAVARFAPSQRLDILDLGCGTGLSGEAFRPLVRTLTGVDISAKMLDIARQRQIYNNLVCGDLLDFLGAQVGNFDLAIAVDVFVYIGDLAPVFAAVHRALRADRLFGFSVETGGEQNFALGANLRYAHSPAYLQRLAQAHGFEVELIEAKILRQEDGVDVSGTLAVLRRW